MCEKGKKVLILGNGFDLAHGLPTQYSHFLEFCKKVEDYFATPLPLNKRSDRINRLLDSWEFNDEIKESLKTELSNINPNSLPSSKDSFKPVEELHDCINRNTWYVYFKSIYDQKLIKGENWIDFESEISDVIQYLDSKLNDFEKNYGKKSFTEDDKIGEFFGILFKRDEALSFKKIRTKCFDDLERITRALEIYLANFVEKINCTKLDVISEIDPDYIINFNYTNTYEKYYGTENVFHIHGTCQKSRSMKDNNMVLGIDEYLLGPEKNRNTNFAIFKKFVQRIRKRTGVENYKYFDEIKDIYKKKGAVWSGADVNQYTTYTDGTSFVYVFGHSLDITDKDILSGFLESDATAVTVYCQNKEKQGTLIENTIRLITQERLLAKVNISPTKMDFIILEND